MTKEIRKILWPTDFSANAARALPYVRSLVEQYGAEVHVLYVIEDLGDHVPYYGEFDFRRIAEIHEWEEKEAQKRLDQVCREHLEGCPLFVRHVAIGEPAREILKLAREQGVDMIVMAAHGRRGHFQFGSVAEKVVKFSPMPVVTVPGDGETPFRT